jgi:hypothetical protein
VDVRLGETDLRRRTVRLMERWRKLEEAIPVSRKAHAALEKVFFALPCAPTDRWIGKASS